MYYLLLIASAFFVFLNNLGVKTNKAYGAGKFLSIVIVVGLAGLLSWIVCALTGQTITKDMVAFAIIFAVLFIVCILVTYKAYEKGSMAGTALFGNASLVIIVLFSVIFYKETLGIVRILGVTGVLLALTLLSLPETSEEKGNKQKIQWTWLILCVFVMLTNSAISITSKMRQIQAGGENPFAYMALCYTFTCFVGAGAYAVMQIKQNSLKADFGNIKNCVPSLAIHALGNAGSNLLVTFLSSRLDATILYSVNQGGGLILIVLSSFLFFKEKKTWKNVVGITLGVVSIVFLCL